MEGIPVRCENYTTTACPPCQSKNAERVREKFLSHIVLKDGAEAESCRTLPDRERLAVHDVENAGSLVGKDVKIQKEGEKFSTFVMGKIR
mgnify:FL=1